MPEKTDLLVIGGGILGLLTAHFASERGFSVKVVDRGSFNSGVSLWLVAPYLCGENRELCLECFKSYTEIAHSMEVSYIRGRIVEGESGKDLGEALWLNGETLLKDLGGDVVRDTIRDIIYDGSLVRAKGLNGDYTGKKALVTLGYGSRELATKFNITLSYRKGHRITARKKNMRDAMICRNFLAVEIGDQLTIAGDSQETEDPSISQEVVRSMLEGVGYCLGRLEPTGVSVGFRTVWQEDRPLFRKIDNVILAGAYKFGFAVAPYLAVRAVEEISRAIS